ncbi:MAG: right-handed parallel beta-helix repeat-containing protein [Candidatus Accumulibacter sp.]|uniref:right-handed parallel beta-helix repeat-containing protein n=1 Tax=Accumulibacter sp. TaxID=2053492 RepID=UPI00258E5CB7|nr:right-handed parallel beta-helix repeat-containing protein [Accumulibacter sp.]MCM8622180.1 right-handed parallel beta-helix repeat-containing protein [Accumulibacter sp.]
MSEIETQERWDFLPLFARFGNCAFNMKNRCDSRLCKHRGGAVSTMVLVIWIALCELFAVSLAYGADLYVSPHGSDSNPGTVAKPFLTLERARDAARESRHDSPITIWLRGGTYIRASSFTLSVADSSVVYRGVAGENVRIIGGRPVGGFRQWRGSILQADLKKQGITDFGELKPRGFHRPFKAALELFFNGRPMTLARWPNRGWAHLGAATVVKSKDQFAYEGDRPSRWLKAPDGWVHGYWMWDWAESYDRIASIDPEAHIIRTDAPHGIYGYKAGQRWRALNLLEELDEPGEWYLDRSTGVLYFWPPASIAHAEVIASMLDQPLVKIDGASNVEFRDITFAYTRGDAILMHGGMHNLISHCTLFGIGKRAVTIEGGSDNGVEDSEIRDTGDGGILLDGGDRPTLSAAGHFAVRNHIHHFGRWVRTYTPAVQLRGVGNRVVGNTLDHGPHMAVMLNGNEHLVEHNDIHTVAMETGDVGAFYLGRDWTERGNTVRANYFHNLGHGDVNAIYLDDCASGTIVDGNIIHRAHRAIVIGGGRDNRIINNKIIDSDIGIQFDARGLGWASFWFDGRDRTLFDRLKAIPFESEPWRSRYPELLAIIKDEPAKPKGNSAIGNEIWGGDWVRYYNNLHEKDLDQNANSIHAKVLPVDPGWVRGIGLDIATNVVESRLTAVSTGADLVVENLGRTPVAGIYDVWVDSATTVKLSSPASIAFNLKPGENRKFSIAVEHQGPAWVGVELRDEGLVPEGLLLK